MDQKEDQLSPLSAIAKGANLNTIIIILGFAVLHWLSGIFLTKEIYYRDQVKLDATLARIDANQEKLVKMLIETKSK